MPIEFSLLENKPSIYAKCPKCNHGPFDQFLRGMVQRFRWFGYRKKYCAVICWNCKKIVGWEDPYAYQVEG